ncbi:MAG: hypothetical protein VKJ06_03795 [Vampirovibrionales bacterium]|nr:hypothetical protein [Vampirovibrionales bacterium]
MGLSTCGRLFALVARKSDIEFEAQSMEQHRMYLSGMMQGLLNTQSKLEPGTEAAKFIEARVAQLQQADKMLEMHLNRIQSQRDSITKMVDECRKIISENIQKSMGLLGQQQ